MKTFMTLAITRAVALAAFAVAASPLFAAVTKIPAGAFELTAPAKNAGKSAAAHALATSASMALAADDAADARALLAAESDPVVFELAATELIDRLRGEPPSAAGTELLQWLAVQPVRVYVRHEETAADWFVPWQAVPARAAGTLEMWVAAQDRQRWRALMLTAPKRALEGLAAEADSRQIERAAEAIAALPDAEFDRFARSAATIDRLPASIAFEIAVRRPDLQMFERVLERGSQQQQLALIARAGQDLPDAQVAPFLQLGLQRPELASAAVMALVAHASEHSKQWQALQHMLDDPELGPSVAAGLAQLPGKDRVPLIEGMLGADPAPIKATHLALALRLEGSPEADAVLRRWSGDERLPAALRKALQP